ncbi:hypothetical protein P7C70_g6834, partial [Phenoliferia sp. Uapishka_3]
MQDNLEFLQWLKKYWDLNFPGGEYDPVGRRKGLGADRYESSRGVTDPTLDPSLAAPAARAARSPVNAPAAASRTMAAKRAPAAAPVRSAGARPISRTASAVPDAALQALTAQMSEMKVSVEGLEKERDFYFNKLRDIEIIIGARLESEDGTITENEKEQLLQMQAILYSTEDGFEVPEGEGEEVLEEEETF